MQHQPIHRIEGLPPMQPGPGYGPPPGQMGGYPPMGNNMMGGPPMYGGNMRMPHGGPGYHMMRPYDHSMPMYGHRQPFGNRGYPGPHMFRHRPPVYPNVKQIYHEVQQTVGSG